MNTVSRFFPDKTFLKHTFSYLENSHSVRTILVDLDGCIDPLDGQDTDEYPHTCLYRFPSRKETGSIGGIRCSAESMEALAAADPHIRFCISGIEMFLEKDLAVRRTIAEILRLSGEHHFLPALIAKLNGQNKPENRL